MNRQLLLAVGLGLLALEGAAQERAGKVEKAAAQRHFVQIKTHASEQEYKLSLRKAFREVSAGQLLFRNSAGDTIRTVPLQTDKHGYSKRAIPTESGAIILKSTSGYEWAGRELEFYGLDGKLGGKIPNVNGRWAASAYQNISVISGSAGSSPRYDNGEFMFVDFQGKELARRRPFGAMSGDASFVFSETGGFGAILLSEHGAKTKRGGIAIFNGAAAIIGTYLTSEWRPLSHDAASELGELSQPIARIDEVNKLVVAQGYEQTTPYIYGISFAGQFLWKWTRPVPRGVATTLALQANSSDLIVIDAGPNETSVYRVSTASGVLKSRASLPFRVVDINSKIKASTSSTGEVLVSLSRVKDGLDSTVNAAILLNENLSTLYLEKNQDQVTGWFQTDGRAVIKKGEAVSVGRFE